MLQSFWSQRLWCTQELKWCQLNNKGTVWWWQSNQNFSDLQINSCDQNLNRCCEIMELSAMIQGKLFTILSQTAREGKVVTHSVCISYVYICTRVDGELICSHFKHFRIYVFVHFFFTHWHRWTLWRRGNNQISSPAMAGDLFFKPCFWKALWNKLLCLPGIMNSS